MRLGSLSLGGVTGSSAKAGSTGTATTPDPGGASAAGVAGGSRGSAAGAVGGGESASGGRARLADWLVERFNFRFVGRMRQCHYIDGRACDRLFYDLLATEHRALSLEGPLRTEALRLKSERVE